MADNDYQGYIPRKITSYGIILEGGDKIPKKDYSEFIDELLSHNPEDLAKIAIDLEEREKDINAISCIESTSVLLFSGLEFNLNDNNGKIRFYDESSIDFSIRDGDPIFLDYGLKRSGFREIISDEKSNEELRGLLPYVRSFSLRLSSEPEGSIDMVIATRDHRLSKHRDLRFKKNTLNILRAYSYWTLCSQST